MKRLLRALDRVFAAILDPILPLRDRVRLARSLSPADIPLSTCTEERLGWSITTLTDYRSPAVAQLIHALKYDGDAHAAYLAAVVLGRCLTALRGRPHERIVIVPIPLHRTRRRERGFNQISLVLDSLPREWRDGTMGTVHHDLIRRVRETPHQTHLTRGDRLSNVAGAFGLTDANRDLSGVHVVLVDDVTTTGATLANAAGVLHRGGARVTLVALARA